MDMIIIGTDSTGIFPRDIYYTEKKVSRLLTKREIVYYFFLINSGKIRKMTRKILHSLRDSHIWSFPLLRPFRSSSFRDLNSNQRQTRPDNDQNSHDGISRNTGKV